MLRLSLLSRRNLPELPGNLSRSLGSLRTRKLITDIPCRAHSNIPSSGKSSSSTHPQQSHKKHFRKIRTLDPAKLTADDYLDFSSQVQPKVRLVPRYTDSTVESDSPRNFTASMLDWHSRRYPPRTHGFMYYHVPAHASPLAGELRFRLTPSRDPASFATGTDLLTKHGQPWRYPLYKIVLWPTETYRAIAALLLQDGLVSQRTLDLAAASIPSMRPGMPVPDVTARKANLVAAMPMLSAFGQEFVYRFGPRGLSPWCRFVGPEVIHKRRIWWVARFQLWVDGRIVQYCPFEGSLVCCFERSTLPQHAGKRVVVIRVKRCLDIQHVPAPDGRTYPEELMPREGELLTVMYHHKVQPWAVDVDKEGKIKTALRVLFENEELYGSPQLGGGDVV